MKPEGVWRCNTCDAMHSLVTVRGQDPQFCPSCGSDRYAPMREQDLDAAEEALATIHAPESRPRSPIMRLFVWGLVSFGRIALARARRRRARDDEP